MIGALPVPLNQFDNIKASLDYGSPTRQSHASLPVPNPTRSFWIDTPDANPLAKEGSEGSLTEDADICIIGSGITGISTTYHLSKSLAATNSNNINAPVRAVILEARDFCSGATGRNGGQLSPAVFLNFCDSEAGYGRQQTMRSFALENYTTTEIVKILNTEELGDAVDFVAGGHVTMLVTEKEIKEARDDYTAAKAAGLNLDDVEWLSKEEMETIYGTSHPAYRFPGYNLWPLKLVTELYNLAKRKTPNFSFNLHTCTPVTSITPSSHNGSFRRWTLNTPRGSIGCSYVIHATNAYASHLLPHMYGPSGIIPTRGQVTALRADASLSQLSKVSWGANEGFEYWHPRPVDKSEGTVKEKNSLVILGGGREVAEPPFEYYETDDSVTNEDVGNALKGFLPGLFPGKFEKGKEPEMEWTGIMGHTKLGDPFVGPVLDKYKSDEHFKGQYISAGYTGRGMSRAFACAEVVAKMVVAELTGQKWIMPEWLPERYLTWARDGETGL